VLDGGSGDDWCPVGAGDRPKQPQVADGLVDRAVIVHFAPGTSPADRLAARSAVAGEVRDDPTVGALAESIGLGRGMTTRRAIVILEGLPGVVSARRVYAPRA